MEFDATRERWVMYGGLTCKHCDQKNWYDVSKICANERNMGFFRVECEHCGTTGVHHAFELEFECRRANIDELEEVEDI